MEEKSELQKRFEQRDKELAQRRKTIQRRHYEQDLPTAHDRGMAIAYCTALVPPEICYAAGVQPFFPENACTVVCAKQQGAKFCEAAESRGISRDVCSYSRVASGMMWLNEGPYGSPPPKPDFILTTNVTCDPHAKWFELYAEYYQVPLLTLENPYIHGKVEPHQVEFVVNNLKELFATVEQITGIKFDYDRFQKVMRLGFQARELFGEIQWLRSAVPCPRGLREVVGDLFFMVAMLGLPETVEYFTLLRDDVKERVQNKIGVLPKEKFRLIWDNIPLWYWLQLFDYFGERGAVFVTDSYPTATWAGLQFEGGHLDLENPLESLALLQLQQDPYLSLDMKIKRFEKMAREWHCDGAVLYSNRGCQVLSGPVQTKEKLIRERAGILTMNFEAEMADPRSLHQAEVKARIDSFLEALELRKKAG